MAQLLSSMAELPTAAGNMGRFEEFPEGTDWTEVADLMAQIKVPELIEQLFGAELTSSPPLRKGIPDNTLTRSVLERAVHASPNVQPRP